MAADQLEALHRAALLHDIGKIGISDSVLKKPGKLSEEQWRQMKQHPGVWIPDALVGRLPGRVYYPRSVTITSDMTEPDTHLASAAARFRSWRRILAVCDAWDAMTSNRPYRAAMSIDQAIEEIRKGSGSQFDPDIAEIAVRTLLDGGGAI